jgi:hypothetical protein
MSFLLSNALKVITQYADRVLGVPAELSRRKRKRLSARAKSRRMRRSWLSVYVTQMLGVVTNGVSLSHFKKQDNRQYAGL